MCSCCCKSCCKPSPTVSPGNRPHLPSEVPLSPWKQPAVCQAKDAAARVHSQTLRREGHVSGTALSFVHCSTFSLLFMENIQCLSFFHCIHFYPHILYLIYCSHQPTYSLSLLIILSNASSSTWALEPQMSIKAKNIFS